MRPVRNGGILKHRPLIDKPEKGVSALLRPREGEGSVSLPLRASATPRSQGPVRLHLSQAVPTLPA